MPASDPERVRVALPLLPVDTLTPPVRVDGSTDTVPWSTVTCTVFSAAAPALTLTVLPLASEKARAVSSSTVCAPGTVLSSAPDWVARKALRAASHGSDEMETEFPVTR